ncbi:RagB/SusD family nutrient uptake outer membrane protein [Pedobacter soli]|uniref:SusD family protein n=1 Tax=Pedobacter soli TaxID=390242 RepID=A0A1G6WZH1_9SPHI|nr:RagB/SusD family nutrient uptake outer membrane protein [Pedobacter soli]SDD70436.1 SusD family protein [Pedobacter soli]
MKKQKLLSDRISIPITIALIISFTMSCGKSFLDKKPDSALVIPQSLDDFQALLDNYRYFVQNVSPSLNQTAADDLLISDAGLKALQAHERDSYIWSKDLQMFSVDWDYPYRQVFYCNIVLDGIETIDVSDQNRKMYNAVKGMALFLRAQAFFALSQTFCEPFIPSGNNESLGVPLPNTSDVTKRFDRGTVAEVYDQIVSDLTQAVELLPEKTVYLSRPSKIAANALLSRAYLSMGLYEEAGAAANDALNKYSTLIDYNALNMSSTRAFPLALSAGNAEMIYYSSLILNTFSSSAQTGVAPELYSQYEVSDLRKSAFFINKGIGILNYRGSYSGDAYLFCGLATDELYLIRAESFARKGNIAAAMQDLNTLLVKRYKTGTYVARTAPSAQEALAIILTERRKELIGRGIRWSDLRRLNREPQFSVTLKKTVDGKEISLPPNDLRYVFPIPLSELAYHDIPQNPR